jgi:hypothetical protein
VLEYISNGMDMRQRRTAPMPRELSTGLERLFDEHRNLSWQPQLCGIMGP